MVQARYRTVLRRARKEHFASSFQTTGPDETLPRTVTRLGSVHPRKTSSCRAGSARKQRTSSAAGPGWHGDSSPMRSEEHTSELQSLTNLVCRLLLEKKKKKKKKQYIKLNNRNDI